MRRLALTLLLTSGCSFLFQEQLPKRYSPTTEPRCSRTNGPAFVDGLIATVSAAALVYVAAIDDTKLSEQRAEVAASAAGLFTFGVSATLGTRWARRCEDAYARWESARGGGG